MLFRSLFLALFLVSLTAAQGVLSTCARMDIPVLDKAARGLCIASCSVQNCGTGDCVNRRGRKTCVCNRCGNGGGK